MIYRKVLEARGFLKKFSVKEELANFGRRW